jgi:hypothetical protein
VSAHKRRLQVFISSTYLDLKEERQAAVEAILRAGHIPAGMELFAAGNKSQVDVIKKWIDESDLFVLLLGHRYGSLEPEGKRSYTQMEYEYAISKGKPFFALVASDGWRLEKQRRPGVDPNTIMEVDHPGKLREFREFVMSRICRHFDDTKDIKLNVMESINDLQQSHELVGWVRGDALDDIEAVKKDRASKEGALAEARTALAEERARLKSIEGQLARSVASGEQDFSGIRQALVSRTLDATPIISEAMRKQWVDKPQLIDAFKRVSVYGLLMWCGLGESLTLGASNQKGVNADEFFTYTNVIPILAVHNLTEEVPTPPAAAWRRFQLSKVGRDFLSWSQRNPIPADEAMFPPLAPPKP